MFFFFVFYFTRTRVYTTEAIRIGGFKLMPPSPLVRVALGATTTVTSPINVAVGFAARLVAAPFLVTLVKPRRSTRL